MLKVQEYLKSGKTLEDLSNEYHILIKEKNNKVSLKYDQIFSVMSEPICQECRGLILRKDSWEIVSFPFMKFFNHGEGFAANIDWNSAKIQEKIDGSMLALYFDNELNQWFFSTHKMPEADGDCELGISYGELAKKCLEAMGFVFDEFVKKLNQNYTYMFEMTSPYNIVYIQYPDMKLTLIGVRDNVSLKELEPMPIAKELGISSPKEYSFTSLTDMIDMVNSWNGTEQEGIVVVDKNFNRIKIKNASYKDGQAIIFSLSASDRNVMRIIMNDQSDDVLPRAPVLIKQKLEDYKLKMIAIIKDTKDLYDSVKNIDDMKEFSKAIANAQWKDALFGLKRGKISSLEEYVKKMAENNAGIDRMIEFCNAKNIP